MMYIDIGVNLALVCKVTLGRQTLTGSTPSTLRGMRAKEENTTPASVLKLQIRKS